MDQKIRRRGEEEESSVEDVLRMWMMLWMRRWEKEEEGRLGFK